MPDAYQILGVSRDATLEEIKKAYRKLAKQNHPDRFAQVEARNAAAERMKTINTAYEQILRGEADRPRTQSGQRTQRHGADGAQDAAAVFAHVRQIIAMGYLLEAEQMLRNMHGAEQYAQWHYLLGVIYAQRGFLEHAAACFAQACAMEPNQLEYARAYRRVQSARAGRGRATQAEDGPLACGAGRLELCCAANLCLSLLGGRFCCC